MVYRVLVWFALLAVITASATFASAQSSLPSLRPGAKILHSETSSIPGAAPGRSSGAGSNLFVPSSGIFTLDYSVEPGKKLMVTMLTGKQYQALSAGRKPDGEPVLKVFISGVGSESVSLQRGNYFIGITSQEPTNTSHTIRGSFRAN